MTPTSLLAHVPPVIAVLLLMTLAAASLLLIKKLIEDLCSDSGPWGVPILGYYPFLKEDYHIQLSKLAQKYGDAYLINICGKTFLHINTKEVAREVFVNKSECFPGRCQQFSLSNVVFQNGMAFMKSKEWLASRNFIIKSIQKLCLNPKGKFQSPVLDSIRDVIKILTENEGRPINISNMLFNQCSEVIGRFIMGDVSKKVLKKINDAFLTTFMPMGGTGNLIYGYVGRYLVAPGIEGFKEMHSAKQQLDTLFTKIINDHKTRVDFDDPQDLIDLYLRERKIRESKGDPLAQCFSDKSFLPTLIQIYGDGGITVSVVLASFVNSLSQRLDIQNEMFEEIRREIGTERLPTYKDNLKLPFVNAMIKELYRTSKLVPAAPSLECSYKTTISGIDVPKGALALVNYHAIHNDPNVYKNPEHFNPRRFISDVGTERSAEEPPMFFNIGKRACPGEELVTAEIFLFLVALIQRFTLTLVEDSQTKMKKDVTELHDTMEVNIIATLRNPLPKK